MCNKYFPIVRDIIDNIHFVDSVIISLSLVVKESFVLIFENSNSLYTKCKNILAWGYNHNQEFLCHSSEST